MSRDFHRKFQLILESFKSWITLSRLGLIGAAIQTRFWINDYYLWFSTVILDSVTVHETFERQQQLDLHFFFFFFFFWKSVAWNPTKKQQYLCYEQWALYVQSFSTLELKRSFCHHSIGRDFKKATHEICMVYMHGRTSVRSESASSGDRQLVYYKILYINLLIDKTNTSNVSNQNKSFFNSW